MKHLFYLLFFSLSFCLCYSQEKATARSPYLFPEFTAGVVLMNSGTRNEALLNYNAFTEEMVFEDKGVKYAIVKDGAVQVDTVFIRDRKFITLNNNFYELVCHSTYDLYAERKCKVNSMSKPDGFRTTSQTSAVTPSSSYYKGLNREKGNMYEMKLPNGFYELELPDGYETKPYTYYWLNKKGELNRFINLKQLMKLYRDKEELFKVYVKNHNVKYEDQESIVLLISFLETNVKN
jgi:hypothetical protein